MAELEPLSMKRWLLAMIGSVAMPEPLLRRLSGGSSGNLEKAGKILAFKIMRDTQDFGRAGMASFYNQLFNFANHK